MPLLHLILRELRHRRLPVGLGLVSVLMAVGSLMATLTLLHEHRLATGAIIAAKEEETRKRLEILQDDVRKLTLKMGFNILILPKDQALSDFYAEDFSARTMPEEYAQRLAEARMVTVNHVLPSLQQKVRWPETGRTVLVIGVRGEVVVHSKQQKQIQPEVRPGEVVLGYELHQAQGLKPGARITFRGHELRVGECRPAKGSKDDITLWMNLGEVQTMLDLPGRINAILALECNCAVVDRLGDVRREVARILPDTQVIEYATQALARAEARNRAETEAGAALAQERDSRQKLEREKEALASAVVPLVLLACAVWIGFMSWMNVRERRTEIGLLRALGVRSRRILMLFLGRAVLIGLAGGCLGYAAGLLAAWAWDPSATMRLAVRDMLAPAWMAAALLAGPLLAALAAWLPAQLAAQQDPADILREG